MKGPRPWRGAALGGAAALLVAAGGCGGRPSSGPSGSGESSPTPRTVLIVRIGASDIPPVPPGTVVARVDVAADAASRARGLMGRTSLPPDTGMLFVYPEAGPRSFWMKDCPIPLDAAFLDGEGRILNVETMAPGAGKPSRSLPYYDSEGDARFVLEMEGGWFAARGLGPGDRADVAPALVGVTVR